MMDERKEKVERANERIGSLYLSSAAAAAKKWPKNR